MVNTADSGERALQVLESCTKLPDIIVLDQNMSSSGGKLLGHEVHIYDYVMRLEEAVSWKWLLLCMSACLFILMRLSDRRDLICFDLF